MEKENLWNTIFSVLETVLTDVNIGEVDIEKVQNATKTISVLKREGIKTDPEKEKKVVSLLCVYLRKIYEHIDNKVNLTDEENREIRICNSLLFILLRNNSSILKYEYC